MKRDFIVLGAGIAGASAAYELSQHGSVLILERESVAGYHTTGRSAAISSLNFISKTIQSLTEVSREFLASPPECFGEHPLTALRQSLWVTQSHQMAAHEAMRAEAIDRKYNVRELTSAEVCSFCPVLKPEPVSCGLLEQDTLDLDVHGMLHGYLRGLKARGGHVEYDAEVTAITRNGGTWSVQTSKGDFESPIVVNAAGAWGDKIAQLAGVAPVGLKPLRRTVFTFDAPAGVAPNSWPFVYDTAEQFYFKLENGIILASTFDEVESPPCDAWPEDYDVALGIDRILNVTTLDIRSLKNKWAGLRTFARDREMVVGEAPDASGFYWVAGHGGIGLMTAPGVAQALASLITQRKLPTNLTSRGVTEEILSPRRFHSTSMVLAKAS